MEFVDVVWGFWNGLTAWIVLLVHIFGGWPEYPVFDMARNGNWYIFGFLVGAGSPFLGAAGAGSRSRKVVIEPSSGHVHEMA
jgi:hypothetical protein